MNILKVVYNFLFTEFEFQVLFKYYLKFQNKNIFLANYFRKKMIVKYGVFIGRNTKILGKITFPHPNNIVIGEGVILHNNITIYQGCTLGLGENKTLEELGNYDNWKNFYPEIEDNVVIYASSTVVGGIKIAHGSIIGANTFVNKSYKENSVIYNKK